MTAALQSTTIEGRLETGDEARRERLVVFGFDVAEISQIRRIKAMRAAGHAVQSFTMRRANMNRDFQPDWPDTHLFDTRDENLTLRAAVVVASVFKMIPHQKALRHADMIFARNMDMLAIAWAARALSGAGRVPLIYECLDINGSLCGTGIKPRLMRAAERFLLNRTQLLVVSSPGFITEYFEALQNHRGPWVLWENKLASGSALPDRPRVRTVSAPDAPLRIGWVGTIRCSPSLALLADLADMMGDRVRIEIHGIIHRHALPDFDAVVGARPNMEWHGPYAYPDDLPRVYGNCDLVWSQDLWQRGNNSDWLLPNRIYEASWAGCPSIALDGTETGRRIAADRLGWTVGSAEPHALAKLLEGLDRDVIRMRGQELLERPAEDFVQSQVDLDSVIKSISKP